jgi:cell division septum initiation protein DivIVA
MLRSLRDLERKISSAENQRDSLNTALSSNENVKSIYTEKRNSIADRIIGKYDEKIKPAESGLSALEIDRNGLDNKIFVANLRLNDLDEKLEEKEGEIKKRMGALLKFGLDKEFEQALQPVLDIIKEKRKKISDQKKDLEKKMAEMNKKIGGLDNSANTLKDKRNKYIRMKERGISLGVPKRETLANHQDRFRTSEYSSNQEYTSKALDDLYIVRTAEINRGSENKEYIESKKTISEQVALWNNFLNGFSTNKKNKKVVESLIIDLAGINNFMHDVNFGAKDLKFNQKDFIGIVERYFRNINLLSNGKIENGFGFISEGKNKKELLERFMKFTSNNK